MYQQLGTLRTVDSKSNETVEKIGYKITINLPTVCFKEITHLM